MNCKVVAIVPAKSESNRVKNKNTRIIGGEELYLKCLRKLKEIDLIDEVYVDTDSFEMAEKAHIQLGVKSLIRDKSYSDNSTDGHELFLQAAKKIEADIYVQVLCTAPFLKKETIIDAIKIVMSGESSSAIAVSESKGYFWNKKEPSYGRGRIPNSVDLPANIYESMSLYVIEKNDFFKTKLRFGSTPSFVYVDKIESIDIDYIEDLELADNILKGICCKEANYFNSVKSVLTTPMLSDTAEDLGIDIVLPHKFISNIPNKLMGRAKTVLVEDIKDKSEWKNIYNGLKIYDYVNTGDVIFINNQVPEYAFFGSLNTALSIRSGASGTIVNGSTRDSESTTLMNYPVYSKSFSCKDVRKKATINNINVTTYVEDIPVCVGDIVFADKDGICVLPKNNYLDIIVESLNRYKNENDILINIVNGKDYTSILSDNGYF